MKRLLLLLVALMSSASQLALGQSADTRVELQPKTVPILMDGTEQIVLRFSLTTKNACELRNIVLSHDGTTDLGNIRRVSVQRHDKNGETRFSDYKSPIQRTTLHVGDLRLEAGTHRFSIQYAIDPGAKLTNRLAADVIMMGFSDGTTWRNKKLSIRQLRLAHNIHKRGQADCHTFRIPAIAKTNSGTLLAVYDMRYNSRKDLQEHIDIGLSRSTDGGQSWSKPRPIMDMGEYGGKPQKENGCSDPGILVDANTGEIFVSACWTYGKPGTHQWQGKGSEPGYDINKSTQFMMIRSTDDGVTWTKPENLTRQLKKESWWLFAPAPTVGITLRDGTLVMPTQARDEKGHPFSNITVSRDHGKTWTVSKPAQDDCSECTIAELSDGRIMINMRDNRNRKQKGDTNGRAVRVTGDLGQTWEVHSSDHKALPAPVCNASLLGHTLKDGRRILLFSNPRNKTRRATMTIQISFDEGKSWPAKNHVLLDELGGAYSGLVMVDDQTVGILYESSAADMVFQKIPLSELNRSAE